MGDSYCSAEEILSDKDMDMDIEKEVKKTKKTVPVVKEGNRWLI